MKKDRSLDARRFNAFLMTVNYEPFGMIRATTRDIHEDGMSVDTGRVALPNHSDVEITLSFRGDTGTEVHRLDASVAESTLEGTRLIFRGNPREALRLLKDFGEANTAPR